MAYVSITSIRGNGSDTITTGKSKDGRFVTITGTIHEVEGLTHRVRTETGSAMQDIGDKFFGVTATLMLPVDQAAEVLAAVSDYYTTNAELDIKDPKVGMVFEVRTLRMPVEGTHPQTGETTYNVIIQNATFVETCEGYDFNLSNMDSLAELTNKAAAATATRSQAALRTNKLMQEGLDAVTPAKTSRKRAAVK